MGVMGLRCEALPRKRSQLCSRRVAWNQKMQIQTLLGNGQMEVQGSAQK